jgi:hypothetical protein
MPGAENSDALPRWGVTTDVVRGSAMRLDIPQRRWNIGDPATKKTLAGFDIRPRSEKPLADPELQQLLELLRSASSFDKRFARRCALGPLVGFRLIRAPATTGIPREEQVEIAIDFVCQKLFVVQGGDDGRPRTVHFADADPSRAEWLSLAKKSLPTDKRLARID